MAQTTSRPIPIPSERTRPFWEGCARGELLLQRCASCQMVWHPPSPICPGCLAANHVWMPARGRGTVYTFSVVHHPFRRVWEPLVPYVVAVVELEEGPHMLTNLVQVDPADVQIGMRVEVIFELLSDTVSMPMFRPSPA